MPDSPAKTNVLDHDVWLGWIERACAINEYAAPDRNPVCLKTASDAPPTDDSPGTDFNRRGTWAEAGLFDAGWEWARQVDAERGLLTRPGKEEGVSASVGMVASRENGWPLFWCWSTSVTDFVPEQPYTRFAVYAVLRHKGDFSAAARGLRAKGYGKPQAKDPLVVLPDHSRKEAPVAPPEGRIFQWMSELQFRPENDKWLWHGYLSRGGVTLLSALWKAGKSTLLSHLIRAFDGRNAEFLGREIAPSRVLYVTEEHEELWAERRDDLGIQDHVGMICRPFRGRATPAEWAVFISQVAATVVEYRFDVVVFDTISKIWPVRDENDAGPVEEALMPVWNITNLGAALLLVHHNRKTEGKEFTGMRGSGSLPAFCETLVEFRRDTDDPRNGKRILTAAGRYRETPPKIMIELTPSGYVSHGDPDDLECRVVIKAPNWRDMLDGIIPADGLGMTVEEIHATLQQSPESGSVRNQDLIAVLNHRFEGGELERTGKGQKGSPYRYCRPSINANAVPP